MDKHDAECTLRDSAGFGVYLCALWGVLRTCCHRIMLLSVIIPVFNESENLPLLHTRLTATVGAITPEYELIFVNDGSRDSSMQVLRALAAQDPEHTRFLDFSRNFGHQIAVQAGLDHCVGQAVVIIDADLQDPPEVIAELYAKLQTGYDVVYAKRRVRAGESWFKKITARAFYRLLASITAVDIPLDTGDFRIMRRNIVEVLRQMPEQNKYLRGQIAWAGFQQTYIEYDRHARNAGESGYPLSKMLRFALDGVTAFSDVPLRMVTWAGFLVSGVAFLIICYALVSRFVWRDYVQGWTSMLLSGMLIGGIQLIGIGIIGEYISRINKNIQNRPLYIVRSSNLPEKVHE